MLVTGENLSITYSPIGWKKIYQYGKWFMFCQKSGAFGLKQVNCEFGTGVSIILGPNGAGKTTLLKLLAGLIVPQTGRIAVNGRTSGPMDLRGSMSYLPQKLGLYPELTAREQLDYIALLKGFIKKREREERVEMVLQQTGLAALAELKIKTYSRGTVQKVGIAQALLGEGALLLDEPTTGLDLKARNSLRNLFVQIGQKRLVILSSSLLHDACCADSVLVLKCGQNRFMGTVSELADYVGLEKQRRNDCEPMRDVSLTDALEKGYRAVLSAGENQ